MLHFPEVSFGFIRLDKLFSRFCSLPLIFLIRNKARIEGVGTRCLVFKCYLQSKKKKRKEIKKSKCYVLRSCKVLRLGFIALIAMPIWGVFIQVFNSWRKWYRVWMLVEPKPKDLQKKLRHFWIPKSLWHELKVAKEKISKYLKAIPKQKGKYHHRGFKRP